MGAPRSRSLWGAGSAVRGGELRAVVSGDVEGGVEEEVPDALPEVGRLDQGGRPDALGGVGGLETQHLIVSEPPEVLPYRCGFL